MWTAVLLLVCVAGIASAQDQSATASPPGSVKTASAPAPAAPNSQPASLPASTSADNSNVPPIAEVAKARQPAAISPDAITAAAATPVQGKPAVKAPDLAPKYDVDLIGQRNIGGGLDFYSLEREMALGRQLSQEVEASAKLITDPVIDEYVNRIGQNLVRHSDSRVPFTIKVLDNDEVNAFALPGGFFYVDSGLILAADSEAELAGVMSHEIAHVAARHATKNMTRAQIWNIASVPLIFIGGPVAYAVSEVAGLAVPLSYLKFSRDAEREADLLGLQYDYASGYDPQAFVQFFEKLNIEKKKPNFLAKAFATHPMNVDRIEAAQDEIRKYLPDRTEYVVDTSEFQDVKARLASLVYGNRIGGAKLDPGRPVLLKRSPESKPGAADDKTDKSTPEHDNDGRPTLKRNPSAPPDSQN